MVSYLEVVWSFLLILVEVNVIVLVGHPEGLEDEVGEPAGAREGLSKQLDRHLVNECFPLGVWDCNSVRTQ